MKRLILPLLLLLIVLVSCQNNQKTTLPQELTAATNPAEAGFCEERLSRLDSIIERYVTESKAINCVAMVGRNGKIVYNKAYGWKDKEENIPASDTDIFRIASMSKAIVSVGLMTLYEEGKFLLDDPLWWYIPEFKKMEVMEEFRSPGNYTTRTAKRHITIRHLLSHSAGIPYERAHNIDAGIPFTSSMDDMTTAEFVRKIATLPLDHEPGERFTYGLSTDVIGYLIEVLSGKPLDLFLRERVLDPLGMDDTYFYLPEEKKNRLVTLYSEDSNRNIVRSTNEVQQNFAVAGPQKIFLGGAGLCSTAADYGKFCQMLLNHGTFNHTCILSPQTVKLMTTVDQLALNDEKPAHLQFGLGFEINGMYQSATTIESIGCYGWGGMYGTHFRIDPSENMFIVLMINEKPWSHGGRMHALCRMAVYQALMK